MQMISTYNLTGARSYFSTAINVPLTENNYERQLFHSSTLTAGAVLTIYGSVECNFTSVISSNGSPTCYNPYVANFFTIVKDTPQDSRQFSSFDIHCFCMNTSTLNFGVKIEFELNQITQNGTDYSLNVRVRGRPYKRIENGYQEYILTVPDIYFRLSKIIFTQTA